MLHVGDCVCDGISVIHDDDMIIDSMIWCEFRPLCDICIYVSFNLMMVLGSDWIGGLSGFEILGLSLRSNFPVRRLGWEAFAIP